MEIVWQVCETAQDSLRGLCSAKIYFSLASTHWTRHDKAIRYGSTRKRKASSLRKRADYLEAVGESRLQTWVSSLILAFCVKYNTFKQIGMAPSIWCSLRATVANALSTSPTTSRYRCARLLFSQLALAEMPTIYVSRIRHSSSILTNIQITMCGMSAM